MILPLLFLTLLYMVLILVDIGMAAINWTLYLKSGNYLNLFTAGFCICCAIFIFGLGIYAWATKDKPMT